VEQPEVVEPLDHLLELHRNVHIDVLIEAGLAGHEAGQGRPVVHPGVVGRVLELLLPPGQLGSLPLQLLLASLKVCIIDGLLCRGVVGGRSGVLGRRHDCWLAGRGCSHSLLFLAEWVIVVQRGASRGGRGAGLLDARVREWILVEC